jgi:hypothetical protein
MWNVGPLAWRVGVERELMWGGSSETESGDARNFILPKELCYMGDFTESARSEGRLEGHKLFLSFSADNRPFVDELIRMLREQFAGRIDPRIVEFEHDPGQEFGHKVARTLRDCTWFLVLLTKESVHSQWVNQEIGYAECLRRIGKITTFIPIVEREQDAVSRQRTVIDTKGFVHRAHDSVPYIARRDEWPECLQTLERYIRAEIDKESHPTSEQLEREGRVAASSGYEWEGARKLLMAAAALLATGDPDRATAIYREAATLLLDGDYAWEAAGCFEKIATILENRGNPIEAAAAWTKRGDILVGESWERGEAYEAAANLLEKGTAAERAIAAERYSQASEAYTESGSTTKARRAAKKAHDVRTPAKASRPRRKN